MKFLALTLVIFCVIFSVIGEDDIFEDPYDFDELEQEPNVLVDPKVLQNVDETENTVDPNDYTGKPSLAGDLPCTMEFAAELFRPMFIEKGMSPDIKEFQLMCRCLVENNCYALGPFTQCVTGMKIEDFKEKFPNDFQNHFSKDEL